LSSLGSGLSECACFSATLFGSSWGERGGCRSRYSVSAVRQDDALVLLNHSVRLFNYGGDFGADGPQATQQLSASVESRSLPKISFRIVLPAASYGDFTDALRAPLMKSANVVVERSSADSFVEAMSAFVRSNPRFIALGVRHCGARNVVCSCNDCSGRCTRRTLEMIDVLAACNMRPT
jgi:hypothetical protein